MGVIRIALKADEPRHRSAPSRQPPFPSLLFGRPLYPSAGQADNDATFYLLPVKLSHAKSVRRKLRYRSVSDPKKLAVYTQLALLRGLVCLLAAMQRLLPSGSLHLVSRF